MTELRDLCRSIGRRDLLLDASSDGKRLTLAFHGGDGTAYDPLQLSEERSAQLVALAGRLEQPPSFPYPSKGEVAKADFARAVHERSLWYPILQQLRESVEQGTASASSKELLRILQETVLGDRSADPRRRLVVRARGDALAVPWEHGVEWNEREAEKLPASLPMQSIPQYQDCVLVPVARGDLNVARLRDGALRRARSPGKDRRLRVLAIVSSLQQKPSQVSAIGVPVQVLESLRETARGKHRGDGDADKGMELDLHVLVTDLAVEAVEASGDPKLARVSLREHQILRAPSKDAAVIALAPLREALTEPWDVLHVVAHSYGPKTLAEHAPPSGGVEALQDALGLVLEFGGGGASRVDVLLPFRRPCPTCWRPWSETHACSVPMGGENPGTPERRLAPFSLIECLCARPVPVVFLQSCSTDADAVHPLLEHADHVVGYASTVDPVGDPGANSAGFAKQLRSFYASLLEHGDTPGCVTTAVANTRQVLGRRAWILQHSVATLEDPPLADPRAARIRDYLEKIRGEHRNLHGIFSDDLSAAGDSLQSVGIEMEVLSALPRSNRGIEDPPVEQLGEKSKGERDRTPQDLLGLVERCHEDPNFPRRWTLVRLVGSGKTTALRMLVRSLVERRIGTQEQPHALTGGWLPVFVPLRRWRDHRETLPDILREGGTGHFRADVSEDFDQAAREGRALLVLDGFDELGDDRTVLWERVLSELETERYRDVVVLLSSRESGLSGFQSRVGPDSSFGQVHLRIPGDYQPKTARDAFKMKFLDRYYSAYLRKLAQEARLAAPQPFDDLLPKLLARDRDLVCETYHEITDTPLGIHLVAHHLVHRRSFADPNARPYRSRLSRAKLLRQVVRNYVNRHWSRDRGEGQPPLPVDGALDWLRGMALLATERAAKGQKAGAASANPPGIAKASLAEEMRKRFRLEPLSMERGEYPDSDRWIQALLQFTGLLEEESGEVWEDQQDEDGPTGRLRFLQQSIQDSLTEWALERFVYEPAREAADAQTAQRAIVEHLRRLEGSPAQEADTAKSGGGDAYSAWVEPLALFTDSIPREERGTWIRALLDLSPLTALRAVVLSEVDDDEFVAVLRATRDWRHRFDAYRTLSERVPGPLERVRRLQALAEMLFESDRPDGWAHDRFFVQHFLDEIRTGEADMVRARIEALHCRSGAADPLVAAFSRVPGLTSVGLWREIPPGWSVRGTPEGRDYGSERERPCTAVRLDRRFFLSATPITVEQYQCFDPTHRPHFGDPHHPVTEVDWYQSMAFCRWLESRLNERRTSLSPRDPSRDAYVLSRESLGLPAGRLQVRLPTETEWEYAARGRSAYLLDPRSPETPVVGAEGLRAREERDRSLLPKSTLLEEQRRELLSNSTAYWTGDEVPDESVMWTDRTRVSESRARGREQEKSRGPRAVAGGSRERDPDRGHPFGLFDVHGNVREWCWDDFGDLGFPAYPLVHALAIDPFNPGPLGDLASDRPSRGGSWLGVAVDARSGVRLGNVPEYSYVNLGFRVLVLPSE